MKTVFKSPLFWTLFSTASIASIICSFYLFPHAFSLINIDIHMDRVHALSKAASYATEYVIGPQQYARATAFSTDKLVQTYAELTHKSKDAFTKMIEENLYSPYTWQVRHFKEFDPHEATFYFKPDGQFYGFYESLSEKEKGEALASREAQRIAEQAASEVGDINFAEYTLVETSQETQPSERVDHTFVYERLHKKLIEAPYRLKLVLSGDKLTQLTHSVKVPDAFTRTYQQMRSANVTIASAANIGIMILYFIGCAVIGLFYCVRRQELIWANPLLWGLGIAILQLLAGLNQLPLYWMYYNTSSSTHIFFMNTIFSFLQEFLRTTFLFSFIIMAAESLTRKAFGHHIQFWKLWSFTPAHSEEVIGQTVAGYLLPPIDLAFAMTFYIVVQRYLGWWNPSSTLVDPNILSCYFPWFESVSRAFQAGFTEEIIFRALPLATATLLGKRFGRKYMWITAAFVLQIIIFGAAHASYPTQPAYARLVELIIPSTIFGLLYLVFGLLPAIISHFVYDVILMSLPVFSFHGAGSLINKLLVILVSCIPLLIVLFAWLRSKKGLITLPERYYNYAWRAAATVKKASSQIKSRPSVILSDKQYRAIFRLGISGAIVWSIGTPFAQEAPALNISRSEAVAQAQAILQKKGIELNDSWRALTRVDGTFQDSSYEQNQHTFVWQKGGQELYRRLLSSFYLHPPFWLVRFARFAGTVSERAEEYHVLLTHDGTFLRFTHVLPEDKDLPSVDQEGARIIATDYLKNQLNYNLGAVKETKAHADKLPARTDWTFTFTDETIRIPEQGQARIDIEISGNTVTDTHRYIHMPEQWKRHQKLEKGKMTIVKQLCTLFSHAFLIGGLIIAIINFGNTFSLFSAAATCLLLFILYFASLVNLWPYIISNFNTSQPFRDQAFRIFGGSLTQFALRASIIGILVMLVTSIKGIYKPLHKYFELTVTVGVSIGLLMTGLNSIVTFFLSETLLPTWADFGPLHGIVPLGAIVNTFMFYVTMNIIVILFIVVANYAHYIKKWPYYSIAPLFVGAFIGIFGLTQIVNITSWLIAGTILGIALFLLYYVVLQYNYAVVPIATAIYIGSFFIQQALFNAYSAAPLVGLVGMIIINMAGIYWSYKMSNV